MAPRLRCLTLLLLIAAICMSSGMAKQYQSADVKAALVGQIIKNIEWPDEQQLSAFHIVVVDDQEMLAALTMLESLTVRNKPIQVKSVRSINQLSQAELVYFAADYDGDINDAMSLLRGSGTLTVVENSRSLHNIMINIVESPGSDSSTLSFQINRPNIAFERLTIKPQLILYGGTELDIASLYHDTELAMQQLRGQNQASRKQLQLREQQLDQQKAELAKIQHDVNQLRAALTSKQQQLTDKQQQLLDKQQQLAAKEQQLADFTAEIRKVQQQFTSAQQQLSDKQAEIETTEQGMQEQMALLAQLKQQVAYSKQELADQTAQLQQTSQELATKSAQLTDQAATISRQSNMLWLVGAVVLFISLILLFIGWLLVKNKRVNRQLNQTLGALEQAQDELVESKKLASLGSMVAGIAHEVNTPLGVAITSSSTLGDDIRFIKKQMQEQALKKSDMLDFIEKAQLVDNLIQANLERCATLVESFKQISADQVVADDRNIHIKEYIQQVMTTLSVVLKRNRINWQVGGQNPEHKLDPGLLSQVISNLVNNAISHAFGENEPLQRMIAIDIKCHTDASEIRFSDNGIGMDETTRAQIFEPFFTTKRGSGGTGLGMNIVHNLVVTKMGGTISVSSESGSGTTIVIKLPSPKSRPSE